MTNQALPPLITTARDLRAKVAQARSAGKLIGLVPTMGALHDGHLSLVSASRSECGFTVVTVFVNPAQFGPGEDFARYPRTLDADRDLLAGSGADLVFAPDRDSIYRAGHATYVEPGGPALSLEGAFRPGHFRGVATVVAKLFNLVQPDRAYFGRKDYQQSLVVRRLVADLDMPVQIQICDTVREPDGLAMSSRNRYLKVEERQRALAIHQSLQLARQLARQGGMASAEIIVRMQEILAAAELSVDYAVIVDPDTLEPMADVARPAVALIAARVGATRLIDNEPLEPPSP